MVRSTGPPSPKMPLASTGSGGRCNNQLTLSWDTNSRSVMGMQAHELIKEFGAIQHGSSLVDSLPHASFAAHCQRLEALSIGD